jgi:hypothetical protein
VNRRFLFLIVGLLAIGVAALFPMPSIKTNCGGNSAAISRVQTIVDLAIVGAYDTPDHSFHFDAANAEERKELTLYARSGWLPRAHFLVSTAPVSKQGIKRIIVVCDTPYRNVPQRWIGSAPPTHAAGFSDGSSGLISAKEFSALDRSAFVALDELYPPKSE